MGYVTHSVIWLLPIALGFFYPVGVLLWQGLSQVSTAFLLSDPFWWSIVRLTYLQAFLSALLSGIFGTALAVVYSENRFFGRAFLWRVSFVCFSLPSVLVALAMLGFWGPRYGWFLVLASHVFFNFPIFLRSCGTALLSWDRTEEKVALSLGASRARCFFEITARKLLPLWKSSFVLAFLYCSSSLLLILLLGGGPKFTTLEVAIYQAIKVDFDISLAARLAMVQLTVSLLLYLYLARPEISPRVSAGPFFPIYVFRSKAGRAGLLMLTAVVCFFLFLGPMARFLYAGISALIQARETINVRAVVSSLGLAVGVGGLAAGYAFWLVRADRARSSRRLALFASLPLAVSPLLLLFSLSVAYPSSINQWRGTLLPILAVQALAALPLVIRPLQAGFTAISFPLYASARSLGATGSQVLRRLEWPLTLPFLALGALYGAAFSLGEVGSVILFLGDGVETLPLEIFRSLGRYRMQEAEALGAVLLFLTLGLQLLVARFER